MSNDLYVITQAELDALGITQEEVDEAGGAEALAHILWFLQNTDDVDQDNLENIINEALEKKKEQEALIEAFNAPQNPIESVVNEADNTDSAFKTLNIKKTPHEISYNIDEHYDGLSIKQLYQELWGNQPHAALKLLVQAYFLDIEDEIPEKDEKKDILKVVSLLRAHIAGAELPFDAEEERIISFTRLMYKEFIESQDEYNHCPMCFLLDEYLDTLPEKYQMVAKALPIVAILKIYAELCFYDEHSGTVEEPIPEEIPIKKLMNLIETLAIKFKIWQKV